MSLLASPALVIYITIDPYAFAVSFRLNQASLAICISFSRPRVSAAPGSTLPSGSRTAVRLTLSTLTGYSWSRRTCAPGAFFASMMSLILFTSASFPYLW